MTTPRPQPVRRPRSWRRPTARLARWLVGWNRPRTHRYHPDCPACRAELEGRTIR